MILPGGGWRGVVALSGAGSQSALRGTVSILGEVTQPFVDISGSPVGKLYQDSEQEVQFL